MQPIAAGPSLPAILLALFAIFVVGILLKKFKLHDFLALFAIFALALLPITMPFIAILFVLLWFLPEKEPAGKRDAAELAAILLLFVLLAAALAGTSFIQLNDGTVETKSGVIDAMVVVAIALSSVSLYAKRSFRNYAANALVSFSALWLYWWLFTYSPALNREDIEMGLFKASGFTWAAYVVLFILLLRVILTLYLAGKTALQKRQGKAQA